MDFVFLRSFIFIFSIISLSALPRYLAEDGISNCPDPDKAQDLAESFDGSMHRPPLHFNKSFQVQSYGANNITLKWGSPSLTFSNDDKEIVICHYKIVLSYSSPQKGANSNRVIRMNVNSTDYSYTVTGLTPNTNITLNISACLLWADNKSDPTSYGYICSKPSEADTIVQLTSAATGNCTEAFYYQANTSSCFPCQCNNNSVLCEADSGICLDCLNNSHGDHCESCINQYELSKVTNKCVQVSGYPTTKSPTYTRENTTTKITTPNTTIQTAPASNTAQTEDICASSPCQNMGTCESSPNSLLRFKCKCVGGYTGLQCEKVMATSVTTSSIKTTESLTTSPATRKLDTTSQPNYPAMSPKHSNSFSEGSHSTLIITVSVLVAVILVSCIGLLVYKKCGGCRKKPMQFWTIQLQNDNNASVEFSDILEPQFSTREDNRLIENDFNSHSRLSFATDDNPYRALSA